MNQQAVLLRLTSDQVRINGAIMDAVTNPSMLKFHILRLPDGSVQVAPESRWRRVMRRLDRYGQCDAVSFAAS
ncbi:MAG: hypothetical protein WBD79_09040 [Anaerolineae bacterium]